MFVCFVLFFSWWKPKEIDDDDYLYDVRSGSGGWWLVFRFRTFLFSNVFSVVKWIGWWSKAINFSFTIYHLAESANLFVEHNNNNNLIINYLLSLSLSLLVDFEDKKKIKKTHTQRRRESMFISLMMMIMRNKMRPRRRRRWWCFHFFIDFSLLMFSCHFLLYKTYQVYCTMLHPKIFVVVVVHFCFHIYIYREREKQIVAVEEFAFFGFT